MIVDGFDTVTPQKRTPVDFLKLGDHGSYTLILQLLCVLRRSVACQIYMPHLAYPPER